MTTLADLEPPVQDTRWNPNHYNGRSKPVTMAILHESVGATDRHGLAAFCARIGVSYHAIADNDGITYTVARGDGSWSTRNANPVCDSLCLCTPTRGYSREEWMGPQYNKVKYAAWWLAIVCEDRGIDIMRMTDRNIVDAYRGDVRAGGVCGHVDWTDASRLVFGSKDGSHRDIREPGFPYQHCIELAQQAAGYADYGHPLDKQEPAPTSKPKPAPAAEGRTHTVVSGDSLRQIAETYGVSVAEIAEANSISDPDRIFVGQVLTIPEEGGMTEDQDQRLRTIEAAVDTILSQVCGHGATPEAPFGRNNTGWAPKDVDADAGKSLVDICRRVEWVLDHPES